ncbi:MAG: lytic transglycosylase domain-containing protein, partial [Acidobacteriota bacterium]
MQMRRWYTPAKALIGFALLAAIHGCGTTQTASIPSSSPPPPSAQISETEPSPPQSLPYGATPFVAPYYAPPERMDLCGDTVPLQYEDVRERFDKEFTLIVYNHAQVYLWLKRMERYFPWIEQRLRTLGLPDDLKYVAIVESDLQPNSCSPKGAAGPWQFMPSTGASYGLEQQGSYDSRFDFERSTECAFRLLGDLYKRYKNWATAIATYNCGDKRILDEMKSQRVNDYYRLKLPTETERYVFRILAIKAVLNNPGYYGYNLPKGQGYRELQVDKVNVNFSSPVSIQTVADTSGTTYREIKRLNPTLRAEEVPAGSFEIKLPRGCGKTFEKNFSQARVQPVSTSATRERSLDDDPPAPAPQP